MKKNVFFWNGKEWLYFGGQQDLINNTLKIETSRLGRYGIFVVSSTVNHGNNNVDTYINTPIVSPQVFTPQTSAIFSPYVEEVKIYNLVGEEIFYSKQEQQLSPIMWTGYDNKGNLVESGLYIYKAKTTSGKWLTGILIFAK